MAKFILLYFLSDRSLLSPITALPAPNETKTSFAVKCSPHKDNHQGHASCTLLLLLTNYPQRVYEQRQPGHIGQAG